MSTTKGSIVERPPAFVYRKGVSSAPVLYCERTPIVRLAQKYGTPLYVYSGNTLRERWRAFDGAFGRFPHTICYSVKANSNLAILRTLARLGCGFDVVSGGELERVRRAAPRALRRVVFSGVGKTAEEIDAALRAGILLFNVESEGELRLLAARAARLKKTARMALRVNPDVPANTHPYISTGLRQHKFGVPMEEARDLYHLAAGERWLDVAGVSSHIGSQITDVEPFSAALSHLADLVRELRSDGIRIRYVDAGGGLGIDYEQTVPTGKFSRVASEYARAVTQPLRKLGVHLLLEPGRSIVGPAGALITRVLYLKHNNGKRFVITDAAMNDLIRPSLYGAYHGIAPTSLNGGPEQVADVVGPICETGDFFAHDRELPALAEGDLLAILDAGAYGMSISSNYNTRRRAAELLVQGARVQVIRRRENYDDILRLER